MVIPPVHTRFSTPRQKRSFLARDITFLQKSYGDYNKVEKPVLVTTSYEESDDEEKLEMVPVVDNNNNNNDNYNVVSYSKSKSEDNFEDDINQEVKATPKTTVNAKLVHVMKN